jgi:4,5-DOPA dioxygenase extradiol
MTTTRRAPALFLGHGSPMNAIENNALSRSWRTLGVEIGRPRAILMVSAHWETKGVRLTGAERPRTIHDFRGFPPALHAIQYPAPGDPGLASEAAQLLAPWQAEVDSGGWGLDHGAWSILVWMYPKADVPVVQLSLDMTRGPEDHYAMGQALRPLRDRGVMVMGSGNIVHNLRAVNFRDPTPYPWATAYDAAVRGRLEARDDEALIGWRDLTADAALAAPDPEHVLPLLYVLGAADPGEAPWIFNGEVASSLSMTSVAFGLDRAAAAA